MLISTSKTGSAEIVESIQSALSIHSLPTELEKKLESIYPAGKGRWVFEKMGLFQARTVARVTACFDIICWILANTPELEDILEVDEPQFARRFETLLQSRVGLIEATLADGKMMKEVKALLGANMSNTAGIIVENSGKYNGGKDIIMSGTPCAASSAALFGNFNILNDQGDNRPRMEAGSDFEKMKVTVYSADIAQNAIRAANQIHEAIFGQPRGKTNLFAAKMVRIPLDFNWQALNNVLQSIHPSLNRVEINLFENFDKASAEQLGDFFSFGLRSVPSKQLLDRKLQALKIGKDVPVEINDVSKAVDVRVEGGIVLSLQKEFVEYICQGSTDLSLMCLYRWFQSWGEYYMRVSGSSRSGVNRRANIPRYVTSATVLPMLKQLREKFGYAVHETFAGPDELTIMPNGTMACLPKRDDIDVEMVKEYEHTLNGVLETLFDRGIPLSTEHDTLRSSLFVAREENLDIDQEMQGTAKSLSRFSNICIGVDPDFAMLVNTSSGGGIKVTSTRTVGAKAPTALDNADILGYDFAEPGESPNFRDVTTVITSMAGNGLFQKSYELADELYVTSAKGEAGNGRLISSVDGKGSVTLEKVDGSGDLLTILSQVCATYQYMFDQKLVPDVKTLMSNARKDMGYDGPDSNLSDSEYDNNLYAGIIENDFTVAEALPVSQVLMRSMIRTLNDAGGFRGSNLNASLMRELGSVQAAAESMENHTHYFRMGKTSTLANMGQLANYFGGAVFRQACTAMLEADRKKVFSSLAASAAAPSAVRVQQIVLPFCALFSRVIPRSMEIFAAAEEEVERLKPDTSISADDIRIPGLKEGTALMPHQLGAHQTLRRRPKYAVLFIAPGGGKCQTKTTRISTDLGVLNLGELWSEGDSANEILDHDFDQTRGKLRPLAVSVMTDNGKRTTDYVYRRKATTSTKVELHDGTILDALNEHRFWTIDPTSGKEKFLRMDEMRVGMYLQKTVGANLYATTVPQFDSRQLMNDHNMLERTVEDFRALGGKLPTRMTVELAAFLGYVVSEGNCGPNGMCSVSNDCPDVLANVSSLYEKVFGYVPETLYSDERVNAVRNHRVVGYWLHQLIGYPKSADHVIPKCIKRAPKIYQSAFLATMFEGDGSIRLSESSNGSRLRGSYCSISKKLVYDVKSLLDNMGIYCSITKKIKHATNTEAKRPVTAYVLGLWEHEENMRMFRDCVGFVSAHKRGQLDAGIAYSESRSTMLQDTNRTVHGPFNKKPLGDLTNKILDRIATALTRHTYLRLGETGRKTTGVCSLKDVLRKGMNKRFDHLYCENNVLTNYKVQLLDSMLNAICSLYGAEVYEAVMQEVESDWLAIKESATKVWIPVDRVVNGSGLKWVYDLSVPGPHTYHAEGYLSHNTILGLTDIAAMMQELEELGEENIRPLILCPTNLVANWCDDLHKIMNGWNAIPITSDTVNTWGEERLYDVITQAPLNTIFVAGLSFLANAVMNIDVGGVRVRIRGAVEFINRFNFSYVLLDESHKVKNYQGGQSGSAVHFNTKSIFTAPSIRYARLATGTLVTDLVSDVVGQAALLTPAIFGDNLDIADQGDGRLAMIRRAHARLSNHTAFISYKRKNWAFMLPNPIDTFLSVDISDPSVPNSELHQQVYDAMYKEMLELLDQAAKDTKKKSSGDDDDDDSSSKDDAESDIDEDELEEGDVLGSLLASNADLNMYFQRIEMLLTDPMGDDVARETFEQAGVKEFTSVKVLTVIDRIRKHFEVQSERDNEERSHQIFQWKPGVTPREYDIAMYNGIKYMARKQSDGYKRLDLPPSMTPPPEDPDYWKEEIQGKLIVFTRYTRAANAVYNALPDQYKKVAVLFHGEVGKLGQDKVANLDAFKTNPNVQILIANEQAISEGHNMQMGSRIIRVDTPWSPGVYDQSTARIFRPDVSAAKLDEDGRPGDMKRELVFIDWIMTNKTLEVGKVARLMWKTIEKTQFDEKGNDRYAKLDEYELQPIKMSKSLLVDNNTIEDFQDYFLAKRDLNDIETSEFAEMRKSTVAAMIPLTPVAPLRSFKTIDQFPVVANQHIPDRHGWGLVRLLDWARNHNFSDGEMLKNALHRMPVVTEFGNGIIVGINVRMVNGKLKVDAPISTVRVRMAGTEELISIPATKVHVAGKVGKADLDQFFKVRKPWATEQDRKRIDTETTKVSVDDSIEDEIETSTTADTRVKVAQTEREAARAAKRAVNKKEGKPANDGVKEAAAKVRKVSKALPPLDNTVRRSTKPKATEDTGGADMALDLTPTIYNGFIALYADATDPDAKAMKEFDFVEFGDYVYYDCFYYADFTKFLDYVEKKYEFDNPSLKRLEFIQDGFSDKGMMSFNYRQAVKLQSQLKQFFLVRHKTAMDKKHVKAYPMVMEDRLRIMFDLNTNPQMRTFVGKKIPNTRKFGTFEKSAGMWITFTSSVPKAKTLINKIIKAGYAVTNLKSVVKGLEKIKVSQSKSKDV
ncbi:DNA helicase [Yersinia phage fHe-Yen9-02]|nr:DNA helicase [Yersinia phage fHe-Yen9-02]